MFEGGKDTYMTAKPRCLTVSSARHKSLVVDLVGNANILSSKRQRIRTSRHSKSIENLKKSHLPRLRLRSGTCQPTPGRFDIDATADDLSATPGIPRITKKRKINRKPNMSRIYTCAPSLHHDAEPLVGFIVNLLMSYIPT